MDPRWFPSLVVGTYDKTSPKDPDYNCIAWAAGESHRHWWPQQPLTAHWPSAARDAETIDAFVEAFVSLGYRTCASGDFEEGVEKIALFALGSAPKHAAKQVDADWWSSKMGHLGIDIRHKLLAVEGPSYGSVVRFLRRDKPTIAPSAP